MKSVKPRTKTRLYKAWLDATLQRVIYRGVKWGWKLKRIKWVRTGSVYVIFHKSDQIFTVRLSNHNRKSTTADHSIIWNGSKGFITNEMVAEMEMSIRQEGDDNEQNCCRSQRNQ